MSCFHTKLHVFYPSGVKVVSMTRPLNTSLFHRHEVASSHCLVLRGLKLVVLPKPKHSYKNCQNTDIIVHIDTMTPWSVDESDHKVCCSARETVVQSLPTFPKFAENKLVIGGSGSETKALSYSFKTDISPLSVTHGGWKNYSKRLNKHGVPEGIEVYVNNALLFQMHARHAKRQGAWDEMKTSPFPKLHFTKISDLGTLNMNEGPENVHLAKISIYVWRVLKYIMESAVFLSFWGVLQLCGRQKKDIQNKIIKNKNAYLNIPICHSDARPNPAQSCLSPFIRPGPSSCGQLFKGSACAWMFIFPSTN